MNWCAAIGDFHSSRDWAQDPSWIKTERLKHDIQIHRTAHAGAGLSPELFDRILEWKMGRQRGRTEQRRVDLTGQIAGVVTVAAFSVEHPDRELLAELRLRILFAMPGVGIGVASAIMGLVFPDKYGVIDFRVWELIFGEEKRVFTPGDYIKYLRELWACAGRLRLDPQVVDFMGWKYWEARKKGS